MKVLSALLVLSVVGVIINVIIVNCAYVHGYCSLVIVVEVVVVILEVVGIFGCMTCLNNRYF